MTAPSGPNEPNEPADTEGSGDTTIPPEPQTAEEVADPAPIAESETDPAVDPVPEGESTPVAEDSAPVVEGAPEDGTAPEAVAVPSVAPAPPLPPVPAPAAGDQGVIVPPAPEVVPPAAAAPSAYGPPPGYPAAPLPQQPNAPQGVVAPSGPAISPALRGHLLRGLSVLGIAVGAAVLGGILLFALLFLLGSGSTSFNGFSLSSIDQVLSGGVNIAVLVVTLSGLVYGGELSVSLSAGSGLFGVAGGGSLWLFPTTITVAALVVVLWWSIRQERIAPTTRLRDRLLFSGAVGLATGLVMLILTLVFTPRIDAQGSQVAITSAGFRVVVFSFLLVGGTVFLGRLFGGRAQPGENWLRTIGRALGGLPRALREVLVYGVLFSVVFGVIGVLLGVVAMWDGLGAGSIPVALLGFLNLAPLVGVLAHFGGVTVQAGLSVLGSSAQTITLANAGSGWLWLLLLVAVLFTAFVAIWIGVRRPRTAGIDAKQARKFPLFVFAGWVVVGLFFFGLTISISGSAGSFGSANIGVGLTMAIWAPLVLLVWAVAIELGAQFLPGILYGLAPQALTLLAGRAATARWVSGPAPGASGYAVPGAGAYAPPVPPSEGGHPFAAPAAANAVSAGVQPAPLAQPQPLSPRARKGLIWGGAGVLGVLLVVVAGAITISVLNSSRTAVSAAEEYLGYIAAGDATAANALVDPNVPNADRGFLTDDVLKAAQERISDVEVTSAQGATGDTAYLSVTYKLDGVSQSASLEAQKGDPEWLVLDTWTITTPLTSTVSIVSQGTGSAEIGGVTIPLDSDSGYSSAEITLYPGVYEVSGGDDEFFELDPVTIQAAGDYGASATLVFTPTQALTDEVTAQVSALLTECAAQTVARPDDCPLSGYVYPSDTPVTWAITTVPTVEISSDGESFYAEGGKATYSYTYTLLGQSEARTDTDTISFYGEIEISDGKVTIVYE